MIISDNDESIETGARHVVRPDLANDTRAERDTSSEGQVYYVYAIARAGESQTPPPWPINGILPQVPVSTLAYRDLLAVISLVPCMPFSATALQTHLQDIDWVEARAIAHQQVLVSLLDSYTLIPLKLCTLFYDAERIEGMLSQNYDQFNAILDRLHGATEWGVKLFCDKPALLDWIEKASDVLRPMRESLAQATAGAAYLLRKKMQLAIERTAKELRRERAGVSHQTLSRYAREAAVAPVQPPELHGRPAKMILNGAYLVDDRCRADFMAALGHLEADCTPQGFWYELTGPWPPYSFAAYGHTGEQE